MGPPPLARTRRRESAARARVTRVAQASARLEVAPEVVRRLDPDAEAQQPVGDVGRARASSAGIVEWVVDAGWTRRLRTSPRLTAWVIVLHALEHAPARVERPRRARRRRGSSNERSDAVGVHLRARERVAGVAGQGRVVHARDARVLGEARGEDRRGLARWRWRSAKVRSPRATRNAVNGEMTPPKPFTTRSRTRATCSRLPQTHAADGVAVAAEGLGHRVHDEVDAERERRLREGRREGVVGDRDEAAGLRERDDRCDVGDREVRGWRASRCRGRAWRA